MLKLSPYFLVLLASYVLRELWIRVESQRTCFVTLRTSGKKHCRLSVGMTDWIRLSATVRTEEISLISAAGCGVAAHRQGLGTGPPVRTRCEGALSSDGHPIPQCRWEQGRSRRAGSSPSATPMTSPGCGEVTGVSRWSVDVGPPPAPGLLAPAR